MSEVLVRFTEKIRGPDANEYSAQACGGIADDGLWEGWIEFAAPGGRLLRTPRETEQPNRGALVYWAEGLSTAYLEGALNRALPSNTAHPALLTVTEPSVFTKPAPGEHSGAYVRPHSVLDPFATYMQGEGVLRQQLSALSRDHLITLIDAHQLDVDADDALKAELIDHIVRAVKRYSRSA